MSQPILGCAGERADVPPRHGWVRRLAALRLGGPPDEGWAEKSPTPGFCSGMLRGQSSKGGFHSPWQQESPEGLSPGVRVPFAFKEQDCAGTKPAICAQACRSLPAPSLGFVTKEGRKQGALPSLPQHEEASKSPAP